MLVVVDLRVWGVVCVCDAHSNKARTGGHQQGHSLLRHPQLFFIVSSQSTCPCAATVRLPLSWFIC